MSSAEEQMREALELTCDLLIVVGSHRDRLNQDFEALDSAAESIRRILDSARPLAENA